LSDHAALTSGKASVRRRRWKGVVGRTQQEVDGSGAHELQKWFSPCSRKSMDHRRWSCTGERCRHGSTRRGENNNLVEIFQSARKLDSNPNQQMTPDTMGFSLKCFPGTHVMGVDGLTRCGGRHYSRRYEPM
ncbi:unnamed protein product, partial [Ectocarpus sp. 13 AM-2016]